MICIIMICIFRQQGGLQPIHAARVRTIKNPGSRCLGTSLCLGGFHPFRF